MKKNAFILFVMGSMLLPGIVRAEEPPMDGGYDNAQEMSDRPMRSMENEGGIRGGRERMGGKMGQMMHQQPTVVATTDGGVVILQGPKLVKYDAQLNLVGEVEMKKMGPPPGKKESSGVEGVSTATSDEDVQALLNEEASEKPQA